LKAIVALIVIVVAINAPDRTLCAHMAEHLALSLVAPLLLLLGAPHALALKALHGESRRRTARVLRWLHPLGHPLVAWPVFAATIVVTHLTALAEGSSAVHALEHLLLIATGLAFWAPVLAPPPAPRRLGPLARVGYLFATMLPMGAVGAVLVTADRPLFAAYPDLHDQAKAGAVMWIGGGLILLAAVLISVWSALVAEERRQQVKEARA
jgi:cytochrome c oxidase assembly factor CtaG